MTLVTELDLPELSVIEPDTEGHYRAHYQVIDEALAAGHWLARGRFGISVLDHDAVRDLQRLRSLHTLGRALFAMQGVHEGYLRERFCSSILSLDGEAHARIRRLVARAFTPRTTDRVRPMMRAWLDERASAFGAAGGGDLMAELANDYPIAVLCELVGAPVGDIPRIDRLAREVMRLFDLDLASNLPVLDAAMVDLQAYVGDLIDRRRREPRGADLISELLKIEDQGDRLTHQELCDLVAVLFMAGTDTTRNQLGLAVLLLATHPEHWARLVADPALVPSAVEEILRIEPAVTGTSRIVAEEFTYRGVTFPVGTYVYLVTAAANRDPAVLDRPTTVDIAADRSPWSPLTFGGGIHYCLGASLARAELQEALAWFTRHWRRIELAGPPRLTPPVGIHGPRCLPLRIEPHGASAPSANGVGSWR